MFLLSFFAPLSDEQAVMKMWRRLKKNEKKSNDRQFLLPEEKKVVIEM